MSTRGHYLRRVGRATRPAALVSVCVDTDDAGTVRTAVSDSVIVFKAASVAVVRRSGSGWGKPHFHRFDSPEAALAFIHGYGWKGERTWVFAPVASDAMTWLGVWADWEKQGAVWVGRSATPPHGTTASPDHREPKPGNVAHSPPVLPAAAEPGPLYMVSRRVTRGKPDIVEYSRRGRKFLWLSVGQYWPCPESEVLNSLRSSLHTHELSRVEGPSPTYRACRRAALWLFAMRHLSDWWLERRAGPFRETASALAYSFLRSRIKSKSITTHKNDDALELESLSKFGARVSSWFYGEVGPLDGDGDAGPRRGDREHEPRPTGPVTHLDVRSMYPFLLREHAYPVSLITCGDGYTKDDLAELLDSYQCVAHVELTTEVPEYPKRRGDRVIYPVGRFSTVLTTPELKLALADQAISRVYRLAVYRASRVFAGAADELIRLRDDARRSNDHAVSTLVKLLANSLTGKLGQRPGRWIPCPGEAHHPLWDEWTERNRDTGATRRLRCTAGLVERLDREGKCRGTLTACYAHLTAFGRAMMRGIRDRCPPRSVLSQHTDGLWVTADAVAALGASVRDHNTSAAGELARTAVSRGLLLLTPAHYHSDHGWVLAGFRSPEVHSIGSVRATYHVNLARGGARSAPRAVVEKVRVEPLSMIPEDGQIRDDGWIDPLRLPLGRTPAQVADRETKRARRERSGRLTRRRLERPDSPRSDPTPAAGPGPASR